MDGVRVVEARGQWHEAGHLIQADAGLELTPDRGGKGRDVRGGQLLGFEPDRLKDLLLALRAPVVTLQVAVTGADVLHRLYPVQVLWAGEHRDSLEPVRTTTVNVGRVVVVHDGTGGYDVDASDRVDHLDEAEQTYPDVVVHVDAEVLRDSCNGRAGGAVRVRAVDLSEASRGQVHVKVSRDRQHGDLFGCRLNPHENHRLGEDVVPAELGVIVRAQEQHGEGALLLNRGGGWCRCEQ